MSKIEAVIFDWAGTTVDFGCMAPVQAFMEAFKAEGIVPTMDEIRGPMGMLKRDHVKTMMSMDRIGGLWKKQMCIRDRHKIITGFLDTVDRV